MSKTQRNFRLSDEDYKEICRVAQMDGDKTPSDFIVRVFNEWRSLKRGKEGFLEEISSLKKRIKDLEVAYGGKK